MKEFLKTVIEHYYAGIIRQAGENPLAINASPLALSDYLFVFPNRRSGLFFCQYLQEFAGKPMFAPKMTTISELFSQLSDGRNIRVPDRIELLLYLYNIYIKVSGSSESFDSFLFWGEMLLSDFDDVDKYMVDAKILFENVRDLKEIDEKFFSLEPEQIKIIRTFWTNFNPEKQGQSKELFRQTWKVLYEVYCELRGELLRNGVAYDGMLQRMIIEDLKQKDNKQTFESEKERLRCLLGKKVVFVGLTALSKTDTELMRHLAKYGLAEFCWDYADARLNDKNSHASYFRSDTIGIFPNVLDEEELKKGLVLDEDKKFEVIEVPSGVGQTVQAAKILKKWSNEGKNALRTAVVLPDEKMLLPMLYSVPKDYEPFNVTMGYSLKATSIATFIDNLAQLQANIQLGREGECTFYYKNVQPLLGTNYLLKMSDGKAEMINRDIVKNNKFRVPQDSFRGNLLLEKVFAPCGSGKECIVYLKTILDIFARQAEQELASQEAEREKDKLDIFGDLAEQERQQGIFSDVEREFLYAYTKLLHSLEEKIIRFNVDITAATFFSLLRKLAQNETVAFTGEPLTGLQVMGVLETRGLDFDNLIILSMNEGVFPARPVTNTFVPMNLRFAFGMPTKAHRDAVYAYHFYRLISRATNIVMLYDSRSEGMQSGEPSRYIKQLTYLYGIRPEMKSVQYNIGVEESLPITVKKDDRVMELLSHYREGGKNNLSASALKFYISCPLSFYLSYVEGLREEDEVEENIDDRTFGLIVHGVMEDIYSSVLSRIITAADIERVIKDREYLLRVIEKRFYKEMKIMSVTGYQTLVKEIILTYVIDILEHDKRLGDFQYLASEIDDVFPYSVCDSTGKKVFDVRLKAVFDRIDRQTNGTLRIVDYKTGKSKDGNKSKLEVPAIEDVFSDKTTCSNEAFQVMLYSLLLDYAPQNFRNQIGPLSPVSPNLYFVRDFHQNPSLRTELRYIPQKKEAIEDFQPFKADFKAAFDKLLIEIFDPDKDFIQTNDIDHCKYCQFKDICNRN